MPCAIRPNSRIAQCCSVVTQCCGYTSELKTVECRVPTVQVLATQKGQKVKRQGRREFLRATAYMLSARTVCCRNSAVCLSVCPPDTRVDQSKTVEVRIMQFSPYSSPIPLVFEPEILTGSP